MSATDVKLYNTLTRRTEPFAPADPAHVRMYVCGPTVYDYAHIGNARPVIVFDLLFRLLREIYGRDAVIYARNITDVDDKINARAARDFPDLALNEAIARVTAPTNAQFQADVAALGCLAPTRQPRATAHIGHMTALIERLVERGAAYVAEGHVLFSVASMENRPPLPRYGALARRSLDEMLAGARVDVAPYKRDAMDFVLWKPSAESEPGWPSPCGIAGRGRPGWHIECSAMSMATLLEPFGGGLSCDDPERNAFDIHGGGIDLVFPHHENEVAQSCCALGTPVMAHVWMHNGFLMVDGEKMSKSLGNFFTIRQLLDSDAFGGRAWSGPVLRLAMMKTHYRQPIDWTVSALEEATTVLGDWKQAALSVYADEIAPAPSRELLAALGDDLAVGDHFPTLHQWAKSGDAALHGKLAADLIFLGLLPDLRGGTLLAAWGTRADREALGGTARHLKAERSPAPIGLVREILAKVDINERIETRLAARAQKRFDLSDEIRDALRACHGIVLEDKKGETVWSFDAGTVDEWMAAQGAAHQDADGDGDA